MQRFVSLLAAALVACAAVPSLAEAQVVYVQPTRVYAPPVYVAPAPVVTSYYMPQTITYSSYYSAPPLVTHAAPAPVVTYSAPAVLVPAGHYETRTYHGFGIFRPRGVYTETYYRPY